jgi:hypothetical protein
MECVYDTGMVVMQVRRILEDAAESLLGRRPRATLALEAQI